MTHRLGAALVVLLGMSGLLGCSNAPDAAPDEGTSPAVLVTPTNDPLETSDPPSSSSVPTVRSEAVIEAACRQMDNLPDWDQISELEPVSRDRYYAEELQFWGDVASDGYADILSALRQFDAAEDIRVAALTRELEIRQHAASVLSSDARYFLESPSQARYRILLMGYGGFLRSIELDPRECSAMR